jgi:hypothetical protein
MIDLIKLLKEECDFVFDNVKEFENDLCYGLELLTISFNDEQIYIKAWDINSGQHIGTSYSIQEYMDWKNKITLE